MIILEPSILAADFNRLGEQIKEIENAGLSYLHLDVMDGNYVPAQPGYPVIASIRKIQGLSLIPILMIESRQDILRPSGMQAPISLPFMRKPAAICGPLSLKSGRWD